MDKMFAPVRRQLGFPIRKKNRKIKQWLRASLDGVEQEVADKDFPGLIFGFGFDPPGILELGRSAPRVFTGPVDVRLLPGAGERLNRLRAHQMKVTSLGQTTIMFGRMLAKIAHSYAVAELGLTGFTPLLLDIIKDPDTPFMGHLVGGGFESGEQPRDDLHEISIDPLFLPRRVVVQIRLFVTSGLPTYWVVAGTGG